MLLLITRLWGEMHIPFYRIFIHNKQSLACLINLQISQWQLYCVKNKKKIKKISQQSNIKLVELCVVFVLIISQYAFKQVLKLTESLYMQNKLWKMLLYAHALLKNKESNIWYQIDHTEIIINTLCSSIQADKIFSYLVRRVILHRDTNMRKNN